MGVNTDLCNGSDGYGQNCGEHLMDGIWSVDDLTGDYFGYFAYGYIGIENRQDVKSYKKDREGEQKDEVTAYSVEAGYYGDAWLFGSGSQQGSVEYVWIKGTWTIYVVNNLGVNIGVGTPTVGFGGNLSVNQYYNLLTSNPLNGVNFEFEAGAGAAVLLGAGVSSEMSWSLNDDGTFFTNDDGTIVYSEGFGVNLGAAESLLVVDASLTVGLETSEVIAEIDIFDTICVITSFIVNIPCGYLP